MPCLRKSLCRKTLQSGGYRTSAATSDRHVAQLVFESVGEPSADYFALSRARFAARAWLQINLLCVLGEVISEREADLVRGV